MLPTTCPPPHTHTPPPPPPVKTRYAPGDPVEEWLNNLLCLDAASHLPKPPVKLPHPDSCELFFVERDTLFSFHKASEAFLQRVRVYVWCLANARSVNPPSYFY